MAILLPFHGKRPRVADSAFIAPTAVLIGDVTVEEEASVWFGAVLRGDNSENGIVVGAGTSVHESTFCAFCRSAEIGYCTHGKQPSSTLVTPAENYDCTTRRSTST